MTLTHNIQIEKNIPKGHPKRICVDGVLYPSINYVYREFNISPTSIICLRNSGMSYEEAISYAIDNAETLNKEKAERARIARENRNKRFLEMKKREEIRFQNAFVFEGKRYVSFKYAVESLSEELGLHLNHTSISASAKRNGITREEQLKIAIDKHLKKKEKRG